MLYLSSQYLDFDEEGPQWSKRSRMLDMTNLLINLLL